MPSTIALPELTYTLKYYQANVKVGNAVQTLHCGKINHVHIFDYLAMHAPLFSNRNQKNERL